MSEPVTTANRKASKVRAFLAAIKVVPSITRAAKAAGIRREIHHRRYASDPVYRSAFDAAYAIGVQSVEDIAAERATEGWQEPVIYKGFASLRYDPETKDFVRDEHGQPIPLTITKIDNRLLVEFLRAGRPEKWRKNVHIDGNLTHHGVSSLTDAELERIARGSGGGVAPPEEDQEQDPELLPG